MSRRKPKSTGYEVTRPPSSVDSFTNTDRISLWPGIDIANGAIDLRAQLDDLFSKHGHYVFLRKSTGRRCACWDEDTKEADPDCYLCTGEGWAYADYKVLARKSSVTDPMVATFLNRPAPPGRMAVGDMIFWLRHDGKPTRLDKIVEVSLVEDTGEPRVPHRIEAIWEINWVYDLRDAWGRVEFWAAWCHNTGLTK